MIEERPSYDTTQFIADVGGSLGFLLGLSVLGLIGILEHVIKNLFSCWDNCFEYFISLQITLLMCGGVIKKMQHKNEKHLKATDELDKDSDTTVDIATIYKAKY